MSSVPSVLRPLTCHSPVRPGGTLKRGSNSSGNISASQLRQGRGPTRVMSPRRTLSSWGSSSRLVLRRNTPVRVTRLSLFSLELPFSTVSSPRSSRAISSRNSRSSPPRNMVRNLNNVNRPPPSPTRSCRKNAGPLSSRCTATAISSIGTRKRTSSNEDTTTSAVRRSRSAASRSTACGLIKQRCTEIDPPVAVVRDRDSSCCAQVDIRRPRQCDPALRQVRWWCQYDPGYGHLPRLDAVASLGSELHAGQVGAPGCGVETDGHQRHRVHDVQAVLQAPPEQLAVRDRHQDPGAVEGVGGQDQRLDVGVALTHGVARETQVARVAA